jgi:hypothetical protein
MTFTSKIPFSQTKATSLCYYKVVFFTPTHAPPTSLMDSTMSPKVKTTEGEGVGALTHPQAP